MGTSKAKKTSKTKAKGRKAKKDEVIEDSRTDVDDNNDELELPAPKKTRGKKRTSDQISGIEEPESYLKESEPIPKRRTTRTRSSTMGTTIPDYSELTDPEDQPSGTRKRSKAGTKRSTSKSRKQTTAKTQLESRIPDDAELEAQLEAELDRPDSDHMDVSEENTRLGASGDAVPSIPDNKQTGGIETEDDELQVEQNKPQTKKQASASTNRTRGSSAKPTFINDSMLLISSDADFEMDNSVFPASHPMKRMQQRPSRATGTTKAQSATNGSNMRGNIHAKRASFDDTDLNETATHMSESDAGYESQEEAHEAPSTLCGIPKNPPQELASEHHYAQETDFHIHTDITSPRAPAAQERTPSPSPQSSDMENQPPSTMLSTAQNALSPSKPQPKTVTIAATTPSASPSKRQGQADQLATTDPWSPVDLDDVFLEDPEDKENVNLSGILNAVKGELTAAEKQMTVEEWIMWNAKNGEQKLRNECERVVGMFEREGSRAMRALEGIECCD